MAKIIDNQFYKFGVNSAGKYGNNLNYEKSSLVIESTGNILNSEVVGEEMDIYNIETEKVNQYREQFQTIRDKYYKFHKDFFGKVNADE